jgi:hypothetical protein
MTDAVTHHADSVTHHAIPDAADKASNRRKRSARPTSAIERGAGRILPAFGTKRTLPRRPGRLSRWSAGSFINHFVPTIIARKRMALRVTAGVTCIGATPKARRQAFTVWIEDSLKGLLSDLALPLWKGMTFCSVTCNWGKPLRVTERASEAIEHKVFNRQFDRVQVFTLIR